MATYPAARTKVPLNTSREWTSLGPEELSRSVSVVKPKYDFVSEFSHCLVADMYRAPGALLHRTGMIHEKLIAWRGFRGVVWLL